ncbi:MAG TPA: SpoIID/LytB domain-containing protein [Thermoanaerobaculia bacterium]|nr:SpoIID/LytB domain-containing protein [Thermoanaerobaculia bacterium]
MRPLRSPPGSWRALGLGVLLLGAWWACRPPLRDAPRPPVRVAPPAAEPEDATPAAPPVEPKPAPAQPDAPAAPGDLLPTVPPSPPPARPELAALPPTIRVGLESDLDVVTLPCCVSGLVALAGGQRLAADRGLVIRPAPQASGLGVYRLQVGALRDEGQARQLAARLGADLGGPAGVVFDAASGLHKVRVGAFGDRAAADAGKRQLAELGLAGAFTVHEDRGLAAAGLVIEGSGPPRRIATRAVDLVDPDGVVRWGERAYRGRLRVFLNERGRLNVINELGLEQYLRGVVPMELGPELYPELEALKAQAVAARSYTVRNLERFAGDGYDICATPRCQVYGGIGVEHPLSDRAISETAGQVAVAAGGAIDALYTSTCGGHTENVATVFPEKSEPYLRGVPCVENGVQRVGASPGRGVLPAQWIATVALGDAGADARSRLEGRVRRLAERASVPRPGDRLDSLSAEEVRRFLASQLDLALDRRLLAAPQAPAGLGWPARDRRLAELLEAWLQPGGTLGPEDADQLAVELLRYVGRLEQVSGRFLEGSGDRLAVARGDEVAAPALAATAAGWRFDGARHAGGAVELAAGDPVDLYLVDGTVVAIVQHATAAGPAVAVHHDRQRWSRFRGRARLDRQIRERFPGFELDDLVVLRRGASGRVSELELLARDGRREVLSGLAIRWTLDVPDTWFELVRTRSRSGEEGWLVEGRGWGHGVGLCQVGAFAMARRGHGYREILGHYYWGIEVREVPTAAVAATPSAP